METFKNLTLEPEIAFHQIAVMIESGLIFSAVDREDSSDMSDCIFHLAMQYAETAHNYARENRK